MVTILSVPILIDIYTTSLTMLWFPVLIFLMLVISLKLKLLVLARLETSGATERTGGSEQETQTRDLVWIVLILALLLSIPAVLIVVLGFNLWFLGLVSFITGFFFSEPALYVYCRNR